MCKRNPCIYVIENKHTGDQYVGMTRLSFEDRWQSHLRDRRRQTSKFYNALNKHGPDQFDVYIWEECSEEKLQDRERYWIDILEPHYNTQPGGHGGGGGKIGRRWKIKDTSKMKKPKTVTPKVLAGRERLKGVGNYQFKGFVNTPWGKFASKRDALRDPRALITDEHTLFKYLNSLDTPLGHTGRTRKDWRGRTPREVGFDVTKD